MPTVIVPLQGSGAVELLHPKTGALRANPTKIVRVIDMPPFKLRRSHGSHQELATRPYLPSKGEPVQNGYFEFNRCGPMSSTNLGIWRFESTMTPVRALGSNPM